MFRFVSKGQVQTIISLVVLFSFLPCRAENVRICIWEGSQKPSLETFKGKYRGQLSLVKWNKKYLVINVMDVEEYLFGVIGKEMDKSWPFEALKAQAVCSRTLIYYYKEIAAKKNIPYDVSDTIYHQVYGGVASENENIIRAVEETSNQILAGQDGENGYNIMPSFFHACCGGRTNSPSETWGGRYQLLDGVDDPYCSGSPFYAWSRSFTREELKSITGTDVCSIKVKGFDKSGRAKQIEIQGVSGIKIIAAETFRMMTINSSTTFRSSKSLPSTMFTIVKNGNSFVFSGNGYGHGVGLCQWGARKMAEEGKNYMEILKYYFPCLTVAIIETLRDEKPIVSRENRRQI